MVEEETTTGTPTADIYLVQDGDTLIGIALKFNMNVHNLKRLNNLSSNVLYPGQVLKVKFPVRSETIIFYFNLYQTRPVVIEETSESPVLVEEDTEMTSTQEEQSIPNPAPSPSPPPPTPAIETPPVKVSTTKSVSKYLSSFFWRSSIYSTVPSSPGKVSEEILPQPSNSPTDILDFEKDAEALDDIVKEDFPSERSIDSLRVVDNEFDAEVVEVEVNSEESTTSSPQDVEKVAERLPVIFGDGKILSTSQIVKLVKYLPIVIQDHSWVLLYSVFRDGADFTTFFSRTRGHNITLVVVEANNGEIFGGLASDRWQVNSKYYGSGSSFLFHIVNDEVIIYPWTMENDFIMWSSAKRIAMGGGGDGFGFVLDDDFLTGQSNPSSAFGNPPLTSYRGSFPVTNVEVWGFESAIIGKTSTKSKK